MILKQCLALLCLTYCMLATDINGVVIRVVDGDTIHVRLTEKNQRIKVRLFGIDAPEFRQRDGAASGRYLASRVGGQNVKIESKGDDQYGRMIAMVYDENGVNLNEEMIRLGLAWVYRKYAQNNDWVALETSAKQARIGLWRRSSPIPPWQYRRENKGKPKK
jgi:micrococcal nuclease